MKWTLRHPAIGLGIAGMLTTAGLSIHDGIERQAQAEHCADWLYAHAGQTVPRLGIPCILVPKQVAMDGVELVEPSRPVAAKPGTSVISYVINAASSPKDYMPSAIDLYAEPFGENSNNYPFGFGVIGAMSCVGYASMQRQEPARSE